MGMEKLREQIFGRPTDGSCCSMCGSKKIKPEDFKNDLSRTEFGISQMCQICQDDAFAPRCEGCGTKQVSTMRCEPFCRKCAEEIDENKSQSAEVMEE